MDALALLEIASVARGYRALDAMVKESPVTIVQANLVEPGKFLILYGGGVAEVESAHAVAKAVAAEDMLDDILIPYVRSEVWAALRGESRTGDFDTVGIVEGRTVGRTIDACDKALKAAEVGLCGLRLTPALGGKAFFVLEGRQHDVEAGVGAGVEILGDRLVRAETIARPHPEFLAWVLPPAPFGRT